MQKIIVKKPSLGLIILTQVVKGSFSNNSKVSNPVRRQMLVRK